MSDKPSPQLSPRESSLLGMPARWLVAAWQRVYRGWVRFAEINQKAAWFPLALAALVAFDALVIVIPGDVVVALAVLSNPRDWKRLALVSGLGSALGGFTLYLLVQYLGRNTLLHWAQSNGMDLSRLSAAQGFFNKYGLFSLALGSVIPGFTWPPVVMAGFSTDRWLQVFAWLLLGRIARFGAIAFGVREGWAMVTAVRKEAKKQELHSPKD